MKGKLAVKVVLAMVVAVGFGAAAEAQQILANTTLASAVGNTFSTVLTTGNLSVVNLTSVAGISAPTPNTGNIALPATSGGATYLYVDRELMQVVSISGTSVYVIRGVGSSAAASHAAGALTFIVPAAAVANWAGVDYGMAPAVPEGSCTRSNELYLPRIQFNSGIISDCLGGQWYTGDALQTTRLHSKVLYEPNPGNVAYTTINTNGTTLVAGTLYCTEVQLPYSKLITGIAVLNGTPANTDNHLVALYDSGGTLLANSATSGVLAFGASLYQPINFTTPFYAVGPAQYFACVQSNGTTATIRMLVTGTQDQYLTTSKTGTFGTLPTTITPPTSFTTAVGPLFGLF